MIPYFIISIKITIAKKYVFHVAESIKIENSTEKIADTCTISLPREFKQITTKEDTLSIAGKNLHQYIKVGDSIKVEAGYNNQLQTEFEGYITKIGAEIPLVLECEDEMYLLKKAKPIAKNFGSVSLKTLLQTLLPSYTIECFDMQLGKFSINNANAFKVLEDLKSRFGLRFFFRGKTLVAGLQVEMKSTKKHEFNLFRNVRKGSDLTYETKEARGKWIKAVSKQKGSSKEITYELGKKGEDEITLHGPVNLNQSELKKWADAYYKNLVFDGYSGSFDSWHLPHTKAGDYAEIIDPNYPDKHRDGQYYISEVNTTIDASSGIKRQNKLSFKIK